MNMAHCPLKLNVNSQVICMPKITKVYEIPANAPKYPEAKVLVYIDGQKCTPVRLRTWAAINLKVGDSISCNDLIELEKHHWKHAYGKDAWDKEKNKA